MWLLVMVNILDFPGIAITPGEAKAPMRVDANAMLPKPVSAKNVQPVAGRDPQVIEATSLARVRCWICVGNPRTA